MDDWPEQAERDFQEALAKGAAERAKREGQRADRDKARVKKRGNVIARPHWNEYRRGSKIYKATVAGLAARLGKDLGKQCLADDLAAKIIGVSSKTTYDSAIGREGELIRQWRNEVATSGDGAVKAAFDLAYAGGQLFRGYCVPDDCPALAGVPDLGMQTAKALKGYGDGRHFYVRP